MALGRRRWTSYARLHQEKRACMAIDSLSRDNRRFPRDFKLATSQTSAKLKRTTDEFTHCPHFAFQFWNCRRFRIMGFQTWNRNHWACKRGYPANAYQDWRNLLVICNIYRNEEDADYFFWKAFKVVRYSKSGANLGKFQSHRWSCFFRAKILILFLTFHAPVKGQRHLLWHPSQSHSAQWLGMS